MSDDTDDNISPSVHLGQSQLQLNVPFTRSHVKANESIPGGHMRHSLKGHHHSSLLIPIKTTLHQRSALLGILINLAQRGTEEEDFTCPCI